MHSPQKQELINIFNNKRRFMKINKLLFTTTLTALALTAALRKDQL